MALELEAPKGFAAAGRDGAVVLRWKPVSGAEGYRVFFYAADEPGKLIKARYSRDCEKGILGFRNGKMYLAEVCAFAMVNGREVCGTLYINSDYWWRWWHDPDPTNGTSNATSTNDNSSASNP